MGERTGAPKGAEGVQGWMATIHIHCINLWNVHRIIIKNIVTKEKKAKQADDRNRHMVTRKVGGASESRSR